MERLIVNVIWKPVGTGIDATRMVCVICRTNQSRKCKHEISCEVMSASTLDDGENGGSDDGSDGRYGSIDGESTEEGEARRHNDDRNDASADIAPADVESDVRPRSTKCINGEASKSTTR